MADKNPPLIGSGGSEGQLLASAPELGYLHSLVAQLAMPYRRTKSRTFMRSNRLAEMEIRAGKLLNPHTQRLEWQSLPYGVLPRILMLHISSLAVKQRSRHVSLGRNLYDLTQRLQFHNTGRIIGKFKEALSSLIASDFTIGYVTDDVAATFYGRLVDESYIYFSKDKDQLSIWENEIALSDGFYRRLIDHAMPVNMNIIMELRHSAVCLDLYTWINYRINSIGKDGLKLSWLTLKEQFGDYYIPSAVDGVDDEKVSVSLKAYKNNTKIALKQVVDATGFRVDLIEGGIHIFPNRPKRKVLAFR